MHEMDVGRLGVPGCDMLTVSKLSARPPILVFGIVSFGVICLLFWYILRPEQIEPLPPVDREGPGYLKQDKSSASKRAGALRVKQGPESKQTVPTGVQKQFDELLPVLRQLSRELDREREIVNREHPLIKQAGEYTVAVHKVFNERYGPAYEQWLALRGSNPKVFDPLAAKAMTLLFPQAIAYTFGSGASVGDTTVKEIAKELIENSEYFDQLKENFVKLARTHGLQGVNLEAISGYATPAEFLAEMQRLSGTLSSEAEALLRTKVEAPEVREAFTRWQELVMVSGTMRSYEMSWTFDLNQKERERDRICGVLRETLSRLPADLPEKAHFASEIIEAYQSR